jgi:hypothetical protein
MTAIESAIPTEVIALYTAIIVACEGVLAENAVDTYGPFRLWVYVLGLVCTVVAAVRQVKPTTGKVWATLRSPEVQAAVLAFAAWGIVLPGSFIYVWLSSSLLSLTVATTTAIAAFLLAVIFAPLLRRPATPAPPVLPRLSPTPPARRDTKA